MNKQSRRDFLKMTGVGLIAAPVLARSPKQPDDELYLKLARLVEKFDRLSPKKKRRIIEAFDSIEIQMNAQFSGEPEAVNELVNGVKTIFQKRLAVAEL